MERFLEERSHEHGVAFVRLENTEFALLGIDLKQYMGDGLNLGETRESLDVKTNV
jgi:hypothetical protein